MPIYEHECVCGTKKELLYGMSKFDENATMACPDCGEMSFNRVMSASNFDCVGAGFYVNDYGKKAWRKNLTSTQQSQVLTGDMKPY